MIVFTLGNNVCATRRQCIRFARCNAHKQAKGVVMVDKTEAPKDIWLNLEYMVWRSKKVDDDDIKYVRADVIRNLIENILDRLLDYGM